MKVLYIGHYKDGTGWGNAAVNNILAMDSAGIEVIPRAVTYESQDSPYPDKIKELEKNKDINNCNIVVQHTLPHNYVYSNEYEKNIGFLAVESDDFKSTGWQHYCNLMDELWVPSETTLYSAKKSGVTVPIKIVAHSLDIESYNNFVPKTDQYIDVLKNTFTFGFVGEFIERKNIKALVQAFHITFMPEEPVTLFIKTSKTNLAVMQEYCMHIKNGLKLRKHYKEEVICVGKLPDDEYKNVLSQINCFVMPSRGEAFCIPGLETMAMGIPSIYTNGIGMDYALGRAVSSTRTPCFGAVDTLSDLDTSDTHWRDINILELSKYMREFYHELSDKDAAMNWEQQCVLRSSAWSHRSIGNKIKEILSDSTS